MNDEELIPIVISIATVVAALIVLMIVLSTPRRRYDGPPPLKFRRRRPSIFLFYCLYVFLLLVGAGVLVLCGPCFPLGGLFLMVLGGMIVTFLLTGRETLSMHVFSALGVSMRQNLPLTTAMEAEARGLSGRAQRVFRGITVWLSQGFPLSEAIKRGYPRCPGYALSMVTAAEHVDQTPRAIRIIERNISDKMRHGNVLQPMYPSYPIAVVSIAVLLLSGLLYFVVPKFEIIFEDMGGPLPKPTLWLMRIGDIANDFGIASLPLALVFWIIPMGLYLQFRPRRPEKPYALSAFGDAVKWIVPPLHWFERMQAQLLTADFLRVAMQSGATIDAAVAGACELDVNLCYRSRLNQWLTRIQKGQNVSDAARSAGIGKTIAWAFDAEVNPGNAPAILEAVASAGRISYAHARNVARSIFWPSLTLVLAAFVGFIAYALFIPLPAMLDNMMDSLFS